MERIRTLIAAEEDERRALERALHDGLLQRLVALTVGLQLVRRAIESDPAEATALLDEVRNDIDVALHEARTLADRLYPALLENQGLVRALQAAAAAAPVPAQVNGVLEATVSQTAALTVHRCCTAALQAVAGDDARATVGVHVVGDFVEFEVSVTDGTVSPGSLVPLAARVEGLGGTLETNSHRVAGRLPVDS
jgi:signal transduction histidine kinase